MIARLGSLRRWPRTELSLGLRSAVAGLLTFGLGQLLGLPQVFWAVLTAVMVMQESVGASLKAVLDRLAGTFGGAVWGVAVAVAMLWAGLTSMALALAVTLVPLALLAALRPAYRVAPVTGIIVLLGSQTSRSGPALAAGERLLDVGLGGLVSLIVALLVLPVRANQLLAEASSRALDVIGEHLVLLLGSLAATPDTAALDDARRRSRSALGRAEAVAEQAERERTHHLTGAPDPGPLVRAVRRLRHDLAAIERATLEPLSEPARARLARPAAAAAVVIAAFLRDAGRALLTRTSPPSLDGVATALDDYAAAMAEVRREGMTRDLSGEAASRIFGLAFALEELRHDLGDLADRISTHAE